MKSEKIILILGRRDEPTDGVVDYCDSLREAGGLRGLLFESLSVPWAEKGWPAALSDLRNAANLSGCWALLQFTTLAWSRHGFPMRAPRVLKILRECGARTGVVFHDISPLRGNGIVGKFRELCQARVFRQLYDLADLGIFTIPINKIEWLPRRDKATFIPVGANCPTVTSNPAVRLGYGKTKTVAVYSVTGGIRASTEVADLAWALKRARETTSPIRLVVFGRGAVDAEIALRSELAGTDVDVECLGLLGRELVSQTLGKADVQLFVRGQISSRRGSAIAGIACGLPIVCYSGPETAWPLTEAGLLAAPFRNREELARSLDAVLSNDTLRETLSERSRKACEKYFSWAAILKRFEEELNLSVDSFEPQKNPKTGAGTQAGPGS